MNLPNRIRELAKQHHSAIVEIRRYLHAYPELSMQEVETSRYICTLLQVWGIPFQSKIAKTGIVATITGELGPGKTIALRADMDALPVQEANICSYASQHPGVMHACGHDVHMASLLGSMQILQQLRPAFRGQVRCIFQPSEEMYPGGASLMIKEGVMESPVPVAVFGQHTLPTLEAGKVGMRAGKYMASTDEIHLTVIGKGGHAATPELVINPVPIAASIITSLQQLNRMDSNPDIPVLLSFGYVEAAGRTNIIPDEVKIKGTIRTFDEALRADIHLQINQIANSIATNMGGRCEVFIDQGYPFLVNDEALTARALTAARELLGEENVLELDMRMTAEDFAYYARLVPACFYRLGVRNEEKGITSNLHTATFDVDETSLETGAALMAWLTINELNR